MRTDETKAKTAMTKELAKDPDAVVKSSGLRQTGQALQMIRARVAEMPPSCRLTYLRGMAHKSPRAAIRSFCYMCFSWNKAETSKCADPACPLYEYRPGA